MDVPRSRLKSRFRPSVRHSSRIVDLATGERCATRSHSRFPGRRHILLTGEGSLQMTAQEISTVMRHNLKPLIFVNQNSGYTVERAVLGKDARYNDIANWRYSELSNVFSRDKKAETYVVHTRNELQKVLD